MPKQQKKFPQFIGLLLLCGIYSVGFSATEPISDISEKLVETLNLDVGLEIRAKKAVPPENLAKSLGCILDGVAGTLVPLYKKHINALFTEVEQREALTFYESDAWKKGREIQIKELAGVFGDEVSNVPPPPSLTAKEQDEIKRFSSSDVGQRFISFVYIVAEDKELSVQLDKIRHNCITVYEPSSPR